MTNWTLIGPAPATSFFNEQVATASSIGYLAANKLGDGGVWKEYSASWPHTTNRLRIGSVDQQANREGGFEIGIGGSGSERSIIDIPAADYQHRYMGGLELPITIREGERVSIKLEAAGSSIVWVSLMGFYDPLARTDLRYADVMGKASIQLLTEPDPGPDINTKGSWIELKDVTANDYKSVLLVFATSDISDAINVNLLFDIGIGANPSEVVFISNVWVRRINREIEMLTRQFHIDCQIPAGVRLSVRCQADNNDATPRQQVGLAIIGLY